MDEWQLFNIETTKRTENHLPNHQRTDKKNGGTESSAPP